MAALRAYHRAEAAEGRSYSAAGCTAAAAAAAVVQRAYREKRYHRRGAGHCHNVQHTDVCSSLIGQLLSRLVAQLFAASEWYDICSLTVSIGSSSSSAMSNKQYDTCNCSYTQT
eukprot:8866-Heterococcus_DN1.PRE.3